MRVDVLWKMARHLGLALGVWAMCVSGISGLSWGAERKLSPNTVGSSPQPNLSPSEILRASRLPKIYSIALSELEELDSEPLCHRIAARLLVNNCQLLDGKDEASVLTDSGRQIRDFVDSYAASLAICDLERGSFKIPSECSEFRESRLSRLPISSVPQLHISSKQIDMCLAGLAHSDSAWNTWISYRHKALRFCEAARVDNEKAQSIHLYQRLTKVMARLADGVEAELESRMGELDRQARQASEAMEQLAPQIGRLRDGLASMEEYLAIDLRQAMRASSEAVQFGRENAEDLQQILTVMIKNVLESNSQMAAAHEQSLAQATGVVQKTQEVNNEMDVFMAAITTAVASSVSLQGQIELSRLQAAEIASRQDSLEQGIQRLANITEDLTSKYDGHTRLLNQALNLTNDLLDTLEVAASSAVTVSESLLRSWGIGSWWPYIVWPSVSLIMGSYGLPPSAFRNLGLLVLGEVVGVVVSHSDQLSMGISSFSLLNGLARGNVTIAP